MIGKRITCAALLLTVLYFAGCATPRPKYASQSFDAQQIDRIVVLPFLDRRVKPNPEHDFDLMCNYTLDVMIDELTSKGYRALRSGDVGAVSGYSSQHLPKKAADSKDADSVDPGSADVEWVKNLGPSSDRWVLVPVFEDLSTQFQLVQFSAKAKISAYLFDRNAGELAWKNVGAYEDQVGLLGAAMANAALGKTHLQKTVAGGAVSGCVRAFPKRTSISSK